MQDRKRALASGWATAGVLAVALVAVVHQSTLTGLRAAKEDEITTIAQVRDLIVDRWVENPDRERLRYGAVEGMVATLDPYSEFISPDKKERFDEDTQGEFGGIGVFIDIERPSGKVVVISPLEDTPAWRAGLLPGDRFLEIDGQPYEFANTLEAQRRLRGKPGSKVTLLVGGEGRPPRTVEIERAVIKIKSVKGGRIVDAEHGIGYVRVTAFQEPTLADFDRVSDGLKKSGLKALVLDLRGNPGGLLRTSTELAERFLEKGKTIVVTRGRKDSAPTSVLAEKGPTIDVPVAVLIDAGSASASEILGGALHDNGRATLVGARSFGKGSVQNVIPVENGKAELKLTTQYYFTPKMRRIHRREGAKESDEWGLIPDIAVPLDGRVRQELVRREGEDELAALKERARREAGDAAPQAPDPPARPREAELKDPQLEAAMAHLRAVMSGDAKIGAAAAASAAAVPSTATAKGK